MGVGGHGWTRGGDGGRVGEEWERVGRKEGEVIEREQLKHFVLTK